MQYLRTFKTSCWIKRLCSKRSSWKNLKEKHLNYLKIAEKIKIDFITFLNNLEVVDTRRNQQEKRKIKYDNKKNNPKCLLVIKKNEKISRNEKCPCYRKKI